MIYYSVFRALFSSFTFGVIDSSTTTYLKKISHTFDPTPNKCNNSGREIFDSSKQQRCSSFIINKF